jgi:N-glycosylase/DNA lyase
LNLRVEVPAEFNFWRTVYSHGWCSLPPFSVDKDRQKLRQIIRLSSGEIVPVELRPASKQQLFIDLSSPKSIGAKEKREIIAIVTSCFRMGEDFSEFYLEAKKHPRFRWAPNAGAGRLLRAQTVFEDVVKMICTTNCSWGLTETMVRNLCTKLGSKSSSEGGPDSTPAPGRDGAGSAHVTFPAPEAIAGSSEKFLRKEIRAGYRAPYLLELSRRVVTKDIELESWRTSTLTTEELFEEVRSVKGVGPYAAGNILKLLGRYDYLAVDSWCRKQFFELHKNGRSTSDKVIEKFYAPFGKWKGLFFWLDVTKHWYDKKFPF